MNATPDKLHVLVTRPVHQAKRLSKMIEKAGGVAHAVPVIEILPAARPDDVQKTIGDIAGYDLFIFISTNAVRHGRDYLPIDTKLSGTVAAVGPTTAQALVRAGLGCDVKPRRGYSSEDLLAEPRLQEVDGQKVLIFRGAGGRALLGDTLTERGASVTYANVYRRRPPPASAEKIRELLAAGDLQVVTATSVETLCNIVDMAGDGARDALRGLTVLTASPRVVKKAAELRFAHDALLARGPDDKSLVNAIVEWRDAVDDDAAVDHDDQHDSLHDLPENDAMASEDKHESGDRIHAYQNKVRDAQGDDAPSADVEPPAGDSAVSNGDDTQSDAAPTEPAPTPEPAPEPDPEPPVSPDPPPPPKPVKSGRGLAALAVLIALLAGAASVYNWWRAQSARSALEDDVRATLDAALANLPDENAILSRAREDSERTASELTRSVEQRLASVDLSAMADLRSEQERLDGSLRGQQRNVSTLTSRLSGLEGDIAAIQGVSTSVRNTWVRAEAEYFLQTANSRLQLANDLESALQALRAADERIGALGDPGLTPVRALLTEEILSVEGVPRPDIEGMALVLNGMTARVRELPFRTTGETNFQIERSATETPNGWGRAKETVGEVFTSIVRVSPSDGTTLQRLAPEESWFLVRNMELQLQVARVALMEKDVENYRGSVRTAMNWLDEYFDGDDQAVRSMRARLADMEDVDIDPEVPDISGSLRLLRQIVSASSASQ